MRLTRAFQLGAALLSPILAMGGCATHITPKATTASVKHFVPETPAGGLTTPIMPVARRTIAPAERMSLNSFLQMRLGAAFLPRQRWAGNQPEFLPVMGGSRVWRPLGPVKSITIHHADGVPTLPPSQMIQRIYSGHTSLSGHLGGSADVAYHFFVDDLGRVWEGRDVAMLGAHVGSKPSGLNNQGNIGICGLGSFTRRQPTHAMTQTMTLLCSLICEYYNRPLEVRGHRDWCGINGFGVNDGGTDCPGLLGPVVWVARRNIAKTYGLPEPKPYPDEIRSNDFGMLAETRRPEPERVVSGASDEIMIFPPEKEREVKYIYPPHKASKPVKVKAKLKKAGE